MTQRRLFAATIASAWLLSTSAAQAQPPNFLPDLGGQPAANVSQSSNLPVPGMLKLDASTPHTYPNQRMAEAIAARLRDSGQLKHYAIDIRYQGGVALLCGRVANEMQRQTALALARTVAGVDVVRDQLLVENRAVTPAQAFDPLQLPEVGPLPQTMINPMEEPIAPPTPVQQGANPQAGGANGGFEEPEAIYKACPPEAMMPPPLMPPYAWPTYAPYNNYSRVAYPTLYPYEAWPFIGPCYPFPKIPMGWRKVTLSWEDGYWWYARNASGHDWWRIRYW